jgi:hypothetical protein
MELKSKLIYPNPFKPVGIEFELPEAAIISLTIIDEKGKDVGMVIDNKQYKAGRHQYLIDLSDNVGKKYVYRLVAKGQRGEFVETKRIG